MRRATVVVLAFIAAFAAPVRAACGATCESAETPVYETPAAACHETAAAPPETGESPATHCSHDHTASVRPAPKAGADMGPLQPVALAASAATRPFELIASISARPPDVSRGSPPLLITLPLRI